MNKITNGIRTQSEYLCSRLESNNRGIIGKANPAITAEKMIEVKPTGWLAFCVAGETRYMIPNIKLKIVKNVRPL